MVLTWAMILSFGSNKASAQRMDCTVSTDCALAELFCVPTTDERQSEFDQNFGSKGGGACVCLSIRRNRRIRPELWFKRCPSGTIVSGGVAGCQDSVDPCFGRTAACVDGFCAGGEFDGLGSFADTSRSITFRTSLRSSQPSAAPSSMPSWSPSIEPSPMPSTSPSVEPSSMPSTSPSIEPSSMPSTSPSIEPSAMPSTATSGEPTSMPSAAPSSEPSSMPSAAPSREPSSMPSANASSTVPSSTPSAAPSREPSSMPSADTSTEPSSMPSVSPSSESSSMPSSLPSTIPSSEPTNATARELSCDETSGEKWCVSRRECYKEWQTTCPTSASCASDKDCRMILGGCGPYACECLPLGINETDPVECSPNTDEEPCACAGCLPDVCTNVMAACINGTCGMVDVDDDSDRPSLMPSTIPSATPSSSPSHADATSGNTTNVTTPVVDGNLLFLRTFDNASIANMQLGRRGRLVYLAAGRAEGLLPSVLRLWVYPQRKASIVDNLSSNNSITVPLTASGVELSCDVGLQGKRRGVIWFSTAIVLRVRGSDGTVTRAVTRGKRRLVRRNASESAQTYRQKFMLGKVSDGTRVEILQLRYDVRNRSRRRNRLKGRRKRRQKFFLSRCWMEALDSRNSVVQLRNTDVFNHKRRAHVV